MTAGRGLLGLYEGRRRSSLPGAADIEVPEGTIRVSALAQQMRQKLESLGSDLRVVGEVASFKVAPQGHWYFDLVDRDAKVSVVIFFKDANRLRRPENGALVVVTAKASYHAPFGKAQLTARHLVDVGEGEARARLERLKQRLAEEGLFALERKRPLPTSPTRIGVVTSRGAAAFKDVLQVAYGRHTGMTFILADTRVQGDGAAADIADAIRRLDAARLCDVLLVVRGGGSREDLSAFDTEPVVRAIVGCHTPVVVGVGHEIDTTLADLAADVRAATPSQAAELAVPSESDQRRRVQRLESALVASTRQRLDLSDSRLGRLERRLPAPASLRDRYARAVQRLEVRLEQKAPRSELRRRREAFERAAAALSRQSPAARLASSSHTLDQLEDRLRRATTRRFEVAEQRLEQGIVSLEALSPLSVLRRGFALVTVPGAAADGTDRLATASDLSPGAHLRVRLGERSADVEVTAVETPERPGDNENGR